MASLSIRDLDDEVRERLRVRAAAHGRSTEAEVRAILTEAVAGPAATMNLGQAIRAAFGSVGGVELEVPPRSDAPRAATFPSDSADR